MTGSTPPLGPVRPAMDLTCGRLIGDLHCGRPAVWHYFWNDDGENGLCCPTHAAEADHAGWGIDCHPVGEVCTMPGTIWFRSDTHPPGYCTWVVDDDTFALVEEVTPDREAELVPAGKRG